MINVYCECGGEWETTEANSRASAACPGCGRMLHLACAEDPLPEGAGAGDFDARLIVTAGPSRVGEQIFLGGCAEIEIGKLAGKHIELTGSLVSRNHCKLTRVDFGPSRWNLEDTGSRNGVAVNGQRIKSVELKDGDEVIIGEYRMTFRNVDDRPAAVVEGVEMLQAVGGDGEICPSCGKPIRSGAKICVPCGIRLPSGRPLVTSQGMDEDALYIRAEMWIKIVSWLVWVTPMPMPLASEAYGTRKPYTIWNIAALTVLCSILFLIFNMSDPSGENRNLLLWNPKAAPVASSDSGSMESMVREMIGEDTEEIVADMDDDQLKRLAEIERSLRGKVPEKDLRQRAVEKMVAEDLESKGVDQERLRAALTEMRGSRGEFRWYQLFTHALLHDPSSILDFVFHLGGNLLFLLVFGSRVNALIGNLATAIIYPILAAAAAGIYLMTLGNSSVPMLGASGAIMGLAGMYLVLFPVHRVYCAMWLRFRWWVAFKIFTLRGFWVLLIYFAYDGVMLMLDSGGGGGVAHWAHLGGCATGIVLGVAILVSRQFNCRGADLLSVVLGRHAWALVGKPSRWHAATA